MTFSPVFSRPFPPTFDRRNAAGAWWNLFGAIPNANVVAAYQPKDAANLAASYVNLVTPGTYDAAPGTAPTWDATSGWIFNGSTQYLTTGITPVIDQSYSAIVRFTDATGGPGDWIFGALDSIGAVQYFGIQPVDDQATPNVAYLHGSFVRVNPVLTAGVLAIAGNRGYRNGVAEGAAISLGTGTSNVTLVIGAVNSNTTVTAHKACKIQAFAIYNNNQAANMAALYTAIAAL